MRTRRRGETGLHRRRRSRTSSPARSPCPHTAALPPATRTTACMMAPSYKKTAPEASATTKLVRELQHFGQDDPAQHQSGLDNEQEDVAAGRNAARSSSKSPQQQHSSADSSTSTPRLDQLSLQDKGKGKAVAPPAKGKDSRKSLKNLLRSTEHTIELAGADDKVESRVLTSWKMADYAYKREPCPFPTRARGLFTERVRSGGDGDEDEYRIVARGYDKFFNIGEVSWTHVSSFPSPSITPSCCSRADRDLVLAVEHDRAVLDRPVRAHDQVERLHHPHRRARRQAPRRHVQAQHRQQRQFQHRGRRVALAARRVLARQARRARRAHQGGPRQGALRAQPDCGRRGASSFLLLSLVDDERALC